MLFDHLRRLPKTLAFRLTLWYAAIFTVSSLIAFGFFYHEITTIVQQRTDMELLEEIEDFSKTLSHEGLEGVKRFVLQKGKDEGEKDAFFRLLTPQGKDLAASDLATWEGLPIDRSALQRTVNGSGPVLENIALPLRRHKTTVLYGVIGSDLILQAGRSLKDDEEFVASFREVFGTTIALVMLLAAAFGWFMAKRALTQVEEVTRTAEAISAQDLNQRVPIKGQADEIDRLATTFNDMLDRIRNLVTETKEMTENIAHDLRSPITRIRGSTEMALTSGRTIADYEAAAANTIEDCDRLLDMIKTMLYISQTEATAATTHLEEVDMARLVRDACELFQPVAEDKGVNLAVEIGAAPKIRGVLQPLQRMLANLLDNAINYTPAPGIVSVSLSGDQARGATIVVSDTGLGIAAEELPHIFRRFYRCDRSRSKAGSGLGLTLVEAIVRAHRGGIAVTSTPNVGTTFTVTLPASAT